MSHPNNITATQINIDQQRRQQEMDKKIDKFFKNYEVHVESDMRKRAIHRYPTRFFTDPTDASICTNDYTIQEEKMYTVSIPESRLKALVELEERMARYIHEPGGHDLLANLLDKERQEATLRAQNEGIAKAYEQYSMLLHLAGYERRF